MMTSGRRTLFIVSGIALILGSLGGFLSLLLLVPGVSRSLYAYFTFIFVVLIARFAVVLIRRGISRY